MKTRDRILECALELFNQRGEPNITTLEIANELGISTGNLYYHFHGKEPLIMALLEHFQSQMAPLLDPPEGVYMDAEDYWLYFSLIVEHLSRYRFLFQDLSNLAGRIPKLEREIRQWLNALKQSLASLLAELMTDGRLESETPALGQLVEQMTMTLLFSLDYQKILGRTGEVRLVVFQLMMLVAPHLSLPFRQTVEALAYRYVKN